MRKKTSTKYLIPTDKRISNEKTARDRRIRSIASSTAIETGEPIYRIEEKIRSFSKVQSRVKLAT